jgi:hypothetical protein
LLTFSSLQQGSIQAHVFATRGKTEQTSIGTAIQAAFNHQAAKKLQVRAAAACAEGTHPMF